MYDKIIYAKQNVLVILGGIAQLVRAYGSHP